MSRDIDFCHLQEIYLANLGKKIYKNSIRICKNCFHKSSPWNSWSNRKNHRKQNCWKYCETNTCIWWTFKKYWRNSYSTRKKTRNIKHIITKLLNNSTISRFATKKWIGVNDLSGGQYFRLRFKTPMLRSNLCNYSDTILLLYKG